jgi:hypothetical protein
VGFESSDVARRRLAAMAMSNHRVQEALVTSGADFVWNGAPDGDGSHADVVAPAGCGGALAGSLEVLAQDIADTPGAGGALLAAFAEQVRVLRLVAEATDRAPGAPLPASVLAAVRAAIGDATFGSSAPRPSWSVAPPLQ